MEITHRLRQLPTAALSGLITNTGVPDAQGFIGFHQQQGKWIEAGAYYSEYYGDAAQRDSSLDYQKDAALGLRFDLRDWWVFKVEGHYIHGTGLLEDNGANRSQDNRGWFMLALKTTFSF